MMIDTKNYKIVFEQDSFDYLKQWLDKENYSQCFILVDENTHVNCLPLLVSALGKLRPTIILVESGEQQKNLKTCQHIWQSLLKHQADRKAVLLNLGGGVIGDMGGFCASTYKRGIDFIQLPTTLLAQVDASVGGKLGIDFCGGKNLIGLFQSPQAVCIYPRFLKTLPQRELYSGYAEVLKHTLIFDEQHWQELLNVNPAKQVDWQPVIQQSIQIKNKVVTKDPLEKGLRKILNFGHTIGHVLESISLQGKTPLLHGEAVVLGMLAEAYLSQEYANLSGASFEQIKNHLRALYPFTNLPELDVKHFERLILQDKKNEDGQLLFTLLKQVGKATFNVEVPVQSAWQSVSYVYEQLK